MTLPFGFSFLSITAASRQQETLTNSRKFLLFSRRRVTGCNIQNRKKDVGHDTIGPERRTVRDSRLRKSK